MCPSHSTNVEEPDFESIYRDHVRYVWDFLRYVGVHASDLEDVAHEVFIVVHRLLSTVDLNRPLRPWISAIAVRVASDYRKKAFRRREQTMDQLPTEVDSRNAESDLSTHRKTVLLTELLNGLPDEQRTVFVLHDVEQHTAPEVASTLEISLNTVYSRLRRARMKMEAGVRRSKEMGLL